MPELNDLFEDMLQDIYYAEKKILQTLPIMANAATSPELKEAFEKHLGETEGQIVRLEQVFASIEKSAKGKKCTAIEGILAEGAELMENNEPGPVLDAGMAAGARAVEHYEMARYSTLVAWATELDLEEAQALLNETLHQEEATEDALYEMTITLLNPAASGSSAQAGGEEQSGEQSDEPRRMKSRA